MFGLVLALLVPRFFADVVRSSRKYGLAPLLGVATLLGVPFLAIIACITIVGLAVGIGGLLLWIVAIYSAQVFVGAWLGEMLLGAPVSTGAVIGRLGLGLLVLRVLSLVPFLGVLVRIAVLLWGLGALTLALYDRMRKEPVAA